MNQNLQEFREKFADEIKKCPDESTMNHIVSQNIKDIMEAYDLKALDLAAICRLSMSGVYRWLNAKNTPKFIVLYPLCKALNVPLTCFAEEKGVMNYILTHKKQDTTHTLEISQEEKQLLLKFRTLSPAIQKAIASMIENS